MALAECTLQVKFCALQGLLVIIIIIVDVVVVTFQIANPNWENFMLKNRWPQQGKQPIKERENYRMNVERAT